MLDMNLQLEWCRVNYSGSWMWYEIEALENSILKHVDQTGTSPDRLDQGDLVWPQMPRVIRFVYVIFKSFYPLDAKRYHA